MTNSSRRRLRHGYAYAVLMASAALVPAAHAQTVETTSWTADTEGADHDNDIVVVGSGETRSVSTLVPSNLEVLPPGTSVQKALNFLPGVSAQSIDALGVNEQSLSLQVRGFNTTHLGYTLDGMPLGDGAYNNYNGLTISRALISENLGRADLATGIAGLGIPSTSNLGGALIYSSSDPKKEMGVAANGTVGSASSARGFFRFDTGEHGGFSAYVSGHYAEQNLFVNQGAYNKSTGKQLNAKLKYQFDGATITAFADLSRTNQADDVYLSKDMLSRLGWDWGGYAPNWGTYLTRAACSVAGTPYVCANPAAPEKASDATFTNGQILRNDDVFYIAGDFELTRTLHLRTQAYHHEDKGAGNNWAAALSNQGTATTADDLPVQIRDTRYTINRSGVLGSVNWDLGINELQAGFWVERNKSSAVRYSWTNVTEPFSLAQFLQGQPNTTAWAQQTFWKTHQFYVQDTVRLFDDTLSFDFGFKSTYSRSNAYAIPGIAKAKAPATTQFATGSLVAKDNFLPEFGMHWQVAPGHEIYASYAENMAMYQGGFKLGPQAVTQTVWNTQGKTLRPETSKSVDGGYRYVSGPLQVSVAGYYTKFNNRLLAYNPCPTNVGVGVVGCDNTFHNVGGVTSKGAEIGVLWKPAEWVSWYNSASYNKSTYNDDIYWCTGATLATCSNKATAGKQQVDTPKEMLASVLTLKQGPISTMWQAKYTGRRYYTYTNDQSFGGYFTLDAGLSYNLGGRGAIHGAKLSVNVTNLTNKRYASNFDSSVFAPDDAAGTVPVFHASAPRQVFGSLSFDF
jgi:iron complex outermembrane recepter protein